jgi:hypothetical protein
MPMANPYKLDHCIRGHKATLVFNGDGWRLVAEGTGKELQVYKKNGGEDVGLHHKNHHAAIRKGAPLNCPPQLELYGVVPVVMGNQSWFERRMLAWDAKKGVVVPA